jgi:hypothetical protein
MSHFPHKIDQKTFYTMNVSDDIVGDMHIDEDNIDDSDHYTLTTIKIDKSLYYLFHGFPNDVPVACILYYEPRYAFEYVSKKIIDNGEFTRLASFGEFLNLIFNNDVITDVEVSDCKIIYKWYNKITYNMRDFSKFNETYYAKLNRKETKTNPITKPMLVQSVATPTVQKVAEDINTYSDSCPDSNSDSDSNSDFNPDLDPDSNPDSNSDCENYDNYV